MYNEKKIGFLILKILIYADIFAWPLRREEILNQIQGWFDGQKIKIKNSNFREIAVGLENLKLETALKQLIKKKLISCKDGYYFLAGKEELVERRHKKERWAKEKMMIARKTAAWLRFVPSILLVGVSGSLAVGNVDKNDDIDFFIICRQGTLWTTRFLAIILLELLGCRRRPKERNFKDKVCLNMFIDEKGLAVPQEEQDLYTACEIQNLKVLWEKEGIYQRFLEANKWLNLKSKILNQKSEKEVKNKKFLIFNFTFSLIEKILKWLQLKYMSQKRTKERLEPHRLLFHPQDKRKWILREYQKRLKKLKFLNIL